MNARRAFLAASAAAHAGATGLWAAGFPAMAAGLAVSNHLAFLYGMLEPSNALLGANISRLPESAGRSVALTFDDGPHPAATPAILDILKRENVRATFFIVGERAEHHPDIVRRMRDEGHVVGNHSQTHPYHFWTYSPSATRREIFRAQESIARACGETPVLFRAPAGIRNAFVHPILEEAGLRLTSWSARAFDTFTDDPERIRRRLVRAVRPGSIALLHDVVRGGKPAHATAAALPAIIADLRERDFAFASL